MTFPKSNSISHGLLFTSTKEWSSIMYKLCDRANKLQRNLHIVPYHNFHIQISRHGIEQRKRKGNWPLKNFSKTPMYIMYNLKWIKIRPVKSTHWRPKFHTLYWILKSNSNKGLRMFRPLMLLSKLVIPIAPPYPSTTLPLVHWK